MNRRKFLKSTKLVIAGIIAPISIIATKKELTPQKDMFMIDDINMTPDINREELEKWFTDLWLIQPSTHSTITSKK